MRDDSTNPTSSGSTDLSALEPWVLGCSGTRQALSGYGLRLFLQQVHWLGEFAAGYVSGGCTGIDFYFGRACALRWPLRSHIVILPADRSRIGNWWSGMLNVQVIEMPSDSSYRDRNQEIVNRSDRLAAWPAGPEDHPSQRRSGTWQTIRMARRQHAMPPLVHALDSIPASLAPGSHR